MKIWHWGVALLVKTDAEPCGIINVWSCNLSKTATVLYLTRKSLWKWVRKKKKKKKDPLLLVRRVRCYDVDGEATRHRVLLTPWEEVICRLQLLLSPLCQWQGSAFLFLGALLWKVKYILLDSHGPGKWACAVNWSPWDHLRAATLPWSPTDGPPPPPYTEWCSLC